MRLRFVLSLLLMAASLAAAATAGPRNLPVRVGGGMVQGRISEAGEARMAGLAL